jgi:phage terminase small subunit
MGRNRTPTAILDAKGAFIANPQRKRTQEPKTQGASGLGRPPKYLSEPQREIWKELAKSMLPGVALESDRDAFEMMVRLTDMMRNRFDEMRAADRVQLASLWSKFAKNPADRSKVAAEPTKESKLDAFLKKK